MTNKISVETREELDKIIKSSPLDAHLINLDVSRITD